MRELGRPYEEWECTKCETTKTWDLSAPWFTIFNPHWRMSKNPCRQCVFDSNYEKVGRPEEQDAKIGEMIRDQMGRPLRRQKVFLALRPGWVAPEESLYPEIEQTFTLGRDRPPPKWVPPCDVCGGNCGQCAESHCGICGVKPVNGPCDQQKHESYAYWKMGAGHEP